MYELIVIGGGPGALDLAIGGAALGARVGLVEPGPAGSTPSPDGVELRALADAARLARDARNASDLGIHVGDVRVDGAALMDHVRREVKRDGEGRTRDALKALGVDRFEGSAVFEAYDTIVLDRRQRLCARHFAIATRARPYVPQVAGLDSVPYLTSETVWGLTEVPEDLLICGQGAEAVLFAQAFARLGSKVTILAAAGPLADFDPDMLQRLEAGLSREGVVILRHAEWARADRRDGKVAVRFRTTEGGDPFEAVRSRLLIAQGKRPAIDNLGLEAIGVRLDAHGGIEVHERLNTRLRNVFAFGEALGRTPCGGAVMAQVRVVLENILLGASRSYSEHAVARLLPADPEVAEVGPIEGPDALKAASHVFETRFGGFAKVWLGPGGKVQAASMIGRGAGAFIEDCALGIANDLSLVDLAVPVRHEPAEAAMINGMALHQRARRGSLRRTAIRAIQGFVERD